MAYEKLKEAVKALASVCDGAVSKDHKGYNGGDSKVGKWLAQTPRWKFKWAQRAYIMLRKYTNQLSRFGIDYNKIPEPTDESEMGNALTVDDLRVLDWEITENGEKRSSLPLGFWDLWNINKDSLKSQGYRISKEFGNWNLYHTEPFTEEDLSLLEFGEPKAIVSLNKQVRLCVNYPRSFTQYYSANKERLKSLGYGMTNIHYNESTRQKIEGDWVIKIS